MKKPIVLISAFILTACQPNPYNNIKNYIDELKIIDTHEHQITPPDSNSFYFFNTTYFSSDLYSAGAPTFDNQKKGIFNADTLWKQVGESYNYSRATSYHEQFMNSLRILYGYDKPYLDKSEIQNLYNRMLINQYKNYAKWFDEVFHKANFRTMLVDQNRDHFNFSIDTSYFKLVCNISSCVMLVTEAAENKKIKSDKKLLKLMNREEIVTKSLEDYTNVIDSVLNIFKRNGAVCIKNVLAYSRTLDFEDVDASEAVRIFNKPAALNKQEKKQLQDFIFHHIIGQAIKLDLPIQIHTGYLAGNKSRIDNGHPMALVNLFIKYPKAKFILFHGGYPWTGDFVALGKHFSNVYLDIVWLPQISKTVAVRTLHEILDAVPYNKIMWGGDVNRIDDAVGSLELGKEVVATVLAERMEKGSMTEELAFEIARGIFHDNPERLFQLR